MTSASTPDGVPPLPGSVPAEHLSVEHIAGRFKGRRHRLIVADEAKLTHAVLVPLYQLRGELCVILTKRTTLVTMQKGHVSFPGGRREPEDPDLLATALRESFEEIGLAPDHVKILGRIDDFSTRDGAIFIAGFVGLIDPRVAPYPWRPAASEVAEILEVPLTHLLDPANVTTAAPRKLDGRWWPDDVFHFRGHRVFGATARALRNLLDIALSDSGPSASGAGANAGTNPYRA